MQRYSAALADTGPNSKIGSALDLYVAAISPRGSYGDHRRHLVFGDGRELHLVVGDVPALDADHTAPGRVAEIGHLGCLLDPGVPHHARRRTVLLDNNAAAPTPIFDDTLPWCIEVDAVGLSRDCDEIRGLQLAASRVGLVDVTGAGEPRDRDLGDVGDREVAVQRLLKHDRMLGTVLHGEAQ